MFRAIRLVAATAFLTVAGTGLASAAAWISPGTLAADAMVSSEMIVKVQRNNCPAGGPPGSCVPNIRPVQPGPGRPIPQDRNRNRDRNNATLGIIGLGIAAGAIAGAAASQRGPVYGDLPPPPVREFYREDAARDFYREEYAPPPRRRVFVEQPEYEEDYAPRRRAAPVNSGNANWCAQRYRSYDPRTGTYVGFDGVERVCR